MIRIIAILVLTLMTVSLASCVHDTGEKAPEPTETVQETPAPTMAAPETPMPTEAVQETPAPTEEPAVQESAISAEDRAALYEVLSGIMRDIMPGSSGSSLRATGCAVKLLKWADASPLSAEAVVQCTTEFYTELDDSEREIMNSCMAAVDFSLEAIMGETPERVLGDIGMSPEDVSVSDAAYERVDAVMAVAGLRGV